MIVIWGDQTLLRSISRSTPRYPTISDGIVSLISRLSEDLVETSIVLFRPIGSYPLFPTIFFSDDLSISRKGFPSHRPEIKFPFLTFHSRKIPACRKTFATPTSFSASWARLSELQIELNRIAINR